MTEDRPAKLLALDEAAAVLDLPPTAVEALIGSGYLVPSQQSSAGPEFPLSDLKAFVARNADNGVGGRLLEHVLAPAAGDQPASSGSLDAQDLLDAVSERTEEMGRRAFR